MRGRHPHGYARAGGCAVAAALAIRQERTSYLRTIVIRDGYDGATQSLHLCRGPSGITWGVHSAGYITYEDPSQGIGPLHEVVVGDPLTQRG